MKTRTRHNCTLEGKFTFVNITLNTFSKDRIKCEICGRIWEEIR